MDVDYRPVLLSSQYANQFLTTLQRTTRRVPRAHPYERKESLAGKVTMVRGGKGEG